jgi:uncharacterized membrane protein
MIARLRSFWLSVNASYWFYPGLFSLLAAILSFVTVYLDRNGMAEWLNEVSWIHSSRPEGARTVLTVIAGSMIAVASTVFSITIAAVAYASGNYGQRLLTNFMQDKGNQLSLGTFIATFVYALMVLRVVRGEDERPSNAVEAAATQLPGFTPQLSLPIATVLALVAVAVLVFFLHHIPDSIRINTVLKGIGGRLIADIRERFPDEDGGVEPEEPEPGEAVLATATGYVKIIDFETLDTIAGDEAGVVALRIRTGDFIHPHKPIAAWSGPTISPISCSAVSAAFVLLRRAARWPPRSLSTCPTIAALPARRSSGAGCWSKRRACSSSRRAPPWKGRRSTNSKRVSPNSHRRWRRSPDNGVALFSNGC